MLKYYNIWVLFTLSLFYLGPISWPHQQSWMVAAVVLSCLVFFNLGTLFGRKLPVLPAYNFAKLDNKAVTYAVIVIFILLSQLHVKSLTGQSILNPMNYSLSFGDVYSNFQQTLKGRSVSAGSLEGISLILKAAILPLVIFLFVINFNRNKGILLLLIFPFIASGMMRGTDKEGVDIGIYLLILAYYHKILGRRSLIALGLLAVLVVLFMERKMARFGVNLPPCLPGLPEACFDFDNLLARYVSPSMEFVRLLLTNYITQGYEGLGRALEIPFEANFGFGHIPVVKGKICQFFGMMCEMQSFGDKLPDYGWNTLHRWQSVYTFLANDFHWFFLPLYFSYLGALFKVSERSWYENRDIISLTLLLLISVFFVYSSANMQLTISLGWATVYLTVFCMQTVRVFRNKPKNLHCEMHSHNRYSEQL